MYFNLSANMYALFKLNVQSRLAKGSSPTSDMRLSTRINTPPAAKYIQTEGNWNFKETSSDLLFQMGIWRVNDGTGWGFSGLVAMGKMHNRQHLLFVYGPNYIFEFIVTF